MKLTAKDVADRLGISYVVAAGLMSHLEDVGKAKVVEKRFHSSGKGKPTRVYEVDQHTTIDFGAEAAVGAVTVETPKQEEVMALVVTTPEPDHVAAALARLRAGNFE